MPEDASRRCANHPTEPATVRCASCARRLCAECWLRNVDGTPWCELCIHHLERRGGTVALTAVFLLLSFGAAALLARSDAPTIVWLLVAGGGIAIAFPLMLWDRPNSHGRRITPRPDDAVPLASDEHVRGHPYRAAIHRATRIVASPVSGRWTTAIVIACMIAIALALPWFFHERRWVEAESVVLGWWMLWTAVLGVLLYKGFRISHDHVLSPPRWPFSGRASGKPSDQPPTWPLGLDAGCYAIGCGEAALAAGALLVVFALAWLVVELLVPALLFFAYLLVRSALARVANDDHRCEGRAGRALGWGLVWATVYTAPLALAIWGAQMLAAGGRS